MILSNFGIGSKYITKWGSVGSEDGQFNYPTGIGIDSSGNVYVADSKNNRIQKFDINSNFITKWGSYGPNDGKFVQLMGIAIDSKDNNYVTDKGSKLHMGNPRIQKFNPDGTFNMVFGSNGTGKEQFVLPNGIAIDSKDNIYVVDTGNPRIQKFNPDGTFNMMWGSFGNKIGQFDHPKNISIDSKDNIYVVDTGNHRIQKFHLK